MIVWYAFGTGAVVTAAIVALLCVALADMRTKRNGGPL